MTEDAPKPTEPSVTHAMTKAIFVALLITQALMWPSPATLFMASMYGFVALVRIVGVGYMGGEGSLMDELYTPGIMLLHRPRFSTALPNALP